MSKFNFNRFLILPLLSLGILTLSSTEASAQSGSSGTNVLSQKCTFSSDAVLLKVITKELKNYYAALGAKSISVKVNISAVPDRKQLVSLASLGLKIESNGSASFPALLAPIGDILAVTQAATSEGDGSSPAIPLGVIKTTCARERSINVLVKGKSSSGAALNFSTNYNATSQGIIN